MASVNCVHILGNVGQDPTIRYLPSGQAVANISVATSSRRKDKSTGESIETTEWHRITLYDRLAEIAGEYVKKGKPVYILGRLKYGKYTDQSGVEKNTVDIIATELQLLGGRDDGEQAPQRQAPQGQTGRGPAPQRQEPQRQAPQRPTSGFEDFPDDDIPY